MSATLLASMLLQVVMIVLLRHRLGRRWLRRPVTLLVLASVVNQGIGPALLAIPSIGVWDNFGLGIQHGFVDSANLIMSAAMLAFTASYLLTHPERTVTLERSGDARIVEKVIDWRLLACVCVPVAVITAAGRGYNDGTAVGQGTSLATNLVATFFIVVAVLTAAAFLLRHGSRWFLLALIAQSGLLAVGGERTPVISDAIGLILLLLFAGVQVPRRQLLAAAALTVMASLAITGVRVHEGRSLFYTNSGIRTRVNALIGDLSAASGTQAGQDAPGLVAQAAVRLSGVDFAGGILQSINEGQPRLSATYVPESLLLAVPSFVWPSKLDRGLALNPAQLQINDFGLQQINYIPALPGLYMGFLSTPWLVALFGFLGIVFGWFEQWLLRECTPVRIVLLAGAVPTALLYEAGLPTMLVQMRAAVALAVVVKIIEMLRLRKARYSSTWHTLASPRPDLAVTADTASQ